MKKFILFDSASAFNCIALSVVFILLNSCRKDLLVTEKGPVAFDAKAWYSKLDIAKSIEPMWQFQQSGTFGANKVYRVPVKRTEWLYFTLKGGDPNNVNLQIVKTDDKISPVIHLEWYDYGSKILYRQSIPKGANLKASNAEKVAMPFKNWLAYNSPPKVSDIVATKASPGRREREYCARYNIPFENADPSAPPCAKIIQQEGEGVDCFEDDGSSGSTGGTGSAYNSFSEPHYLLETNMFYSYGTWVEFFQEYEDVIDFYEQNGYFNIYDPSLPPDLKYLLENYYTEITQEIAFLKSNPQFVLYGTSLTFVYGTAFGNLTKKTLLASSVPAPGAASLLEANINFITGVLSLDSSTKLWLHSNTDVVEKIKDALARNTINASLKSVINTDIQNIRSGNVIVSDGTSGEDNGTYTTDDYDLTDYGEYQDQDPWPTIKPEDVIPISLFVKRLTPSQNCLTLAIQQMNTKGLTVSGWDPGGQTYQTYTEAGGVNQTETKKAVKYIIQSLQSLKPVLIGVDYKVGAPTANGDASTDHFLVIVGMGTDANGKYFQLYDNAFGAAMDGADRHNKLYYNSATGKISGRPISGFLNLQPGPTHDYILTQIRKSKPKP